jgi:hypothetical protein
MMLDNGHNTMLTEPTEGRRLTHEKKATLFSTSLLLSFHSTEGKGRKEARCEARRRSGTPPAVEYCVHVMEAGRLTRFDTKGT